ncbi:hypothetical protein [Streptomyces sp. NBC_00280]|uniref:hypothetical protein n=1 Tax=Streptomyces sp. NBC_00280 TaxID=2975699 RepID=UPI0032479505
MSTFAGTSASYRRFPLGVSVALAPFADGGVLTEGNAFTLPTARRPLANEGL